MKMGRPRRSRRRRALLANATVAVAVLTGATPASAAPQLTTVAEGVGSAALAPGADGLMWSLHYDGTKSVLARHDAAGIRSSVGLDVSLRHLRSDLTALANGGMAAVFAVPGTPPRLVRLGADGAQRATSLLPAAARGATGFAIDGDGSVWFAKLCQDALYRWKAEAAARRFALPRQGCATGSGPGTTPIEIGPDGSVWSASSEQRRIVRLGVRGKVRQWTMPEIGADDYTGRLHIVADPRGGGAAWYGAWSGGELGGHVTPAGRLVAASLGGIAQYAPDGTLWRTGNPDQFGDGGFVYERTTPAGETTRVELPAGAEPFTLGLARDARPWSLAGRFRVVPSSEGSFRDLTFGPLEALRDGPGTPPASLPLAERVSYGDTAFALGPDGAFWSAIPAQSTPLSLVRLVPDGVGAPRRAVATTARVLVRSGRTVTLQLACSADPGRWCRGTVGLRDAAAARPFIVGGASRAAVQVTLGARAARTLRRGGEVRTTAVTRSGGRTTRRTLVLRPGGA